jgi:AdoMet-dependent heme synthase
MSLPVEPCHEIASETPDAFSVISEVQHAAFRDIVPLNVTLELTQDCNIRCVHCYNFDRDQPIAKAVQAQGGCHPAKATSQANLSLDEIRDVMRQVRDAGCLFLSLTGGEVLSYPHLFEVLDEAAALNFAVLILTNGTMLRPGVVGRLAGYRNLLCVSVSLYGATAEVHDRVTQVAGSFRRTWDGIKRLRAQGLSVRVKFIVMRQNAHEVEAMLANARSLDLPFMIDMTITQRHDGTAGSLAARISPAQIAALYSGPLREFVPKGKFSEGSWSCNCARGNCAVTAVGDVQPCISVPMRAGNVREDSFREIWDSSPVFKRIRGLELSDFPSCAPCKDKGFCGHSRGASYTYSGSYTGIDPFLCEAAAAARTVSEDSTPVAP